MSGQMKFIMFGCILAVVPTATILIITYGLEPKLIYKDCSDLLRENAKLKDDFRFLKTEYRKEKDFNWKFKMYWWDLVNEHNKICTHPRIGLIGISTNDK